MKKLVSAGIWMLWTVTFCVMPILIMFFVSALYRSSTWRFGDEIMSGAFGFISLGLVASCEIDLVRMLREASQSFSKRLFTSSFLRFMPWLLLLSVVTHFVVSNVVPSYLIDYRISRAFSIGVFMVACIYAFSIRMIIEYGEEKR